MSEKVINLEVLPEDAQRELIDFYEYLVKKYGKRESLELTDIYKKYSVELPEGYRFDRNEAHER